MRLNLEKGQNQVTSVHLWTAELPMQNSTKLSFLQKPKMQLAKKEPKKIPVSVLLLQSTVHSSVAEPLCSKLPSLGDNKFHNLLQQFHFHLQDQIVDDIQGQCCPPFPALSFLTAFSAFCRVLEEEAATKRPREIIEQHLSLHIRNTRSTKVVDPMIFRITFHY